MGIKYTWHEAKRLVNLEKHKLDFIDADCVIDSPYRFDIETVRNGEYRQQSFAYVFERLMVLTVVYIPNEKPHIISFRPAKNSEREICLKMTTMTTKQMRAARERGESKTDWALLRQNILDGIEPEDDEDSPDATLIMREVVEKRRVGRPAGSGDKEQVAFRFDKDILSAFRASGSGWQTRINEALRDWLNTHSHSG